MTNLGLFLLNWFLPFGGSRPVPFSLGRPVPAVSGSLGQQQEVRLVTAAWRETTTTYYCFIQEQQLSLIVWRKRRNTCFTLSKLPYFIPTYKRYSHSSYWGHAFSNVLTTLLHYRKALSYLCAHQKLRHSKIKLLKITKSLQSRRETPYLEKTS